MFIYDKNEGGVDVRRIENKLGIHGSPTCELVYKNAKAELCGDRKLGLIKYVMALMNGARLDIFPEKKVHSEGEECTESKRLEDFERQIGLFYCIATVS